MRAQSKSKFSFKPKRGHPAPIPCEIKHVKCVQQLLSFTPSKRTPAGEVVRVFSISDDEMKKCANFFKEEANGKRASKQKNYEAKTVKYEAFFRDFNKKSVKQAERLGKRLSVKGNKIKLEQGNQLMRQSSQTNQINAAADQTIVKKPEEKNVEFPNVSNEKGGVKNIRPGPKMARSPSTDFLQQLDQDPPIEEKAKIRRVKSNSVEDIKNLEEGKKEEKREERLKNKSNKRQSWIQNVFKRKTEYSSSDSSAPINADESDKLCKNVSNNSNQDDRNNSFRYSKNSINT